MRPARVGLSAVHAVMPGPEACASAIGNTGVDVVSSPWLVGLLEEASHRLVRDLYEPGEGTVGVQLTLSHLAAALPGGEVCAHARLAAVDGRRLRFEVAAFQGKRELMRGTHERVVVDLNRFMSAAARSADVIAQTPGPTAANERSPIAFYFDFHSPWCWFASLRIDALAVRAKRAVDWRPIHLAKLMDRIGGRRPLEANAAFVHWFKEDMQETARAMGLDLHYHPRFPLRPARALRASVYAARQGLAAPFVQAVMRAYWSEGGDIENPDTIAALGRRSGLVPEELVAATTDESCKQAVERNTELAIAAGAFGAPSFVCDGRLFWGCDRMDRLEAWACRPRGAE